jgi:hypothetical protein
MSSRKTTIGPSHHLLECLKKYVILARKPGSPCICVFLVAIFLYNPTGRPRVNSSSMAGCCCLRAQYSIGMRLVNMYPDTAKVQA